MRSRVLAGVTIIGLVFSTGCGGDDDDTAEPVEDVDDAIEPTTTATDESTTTTLHPESPEAQAVAVYLDGSKFLEEELAIRPPQAPRQEIENYFSGQALKNSLDAIGLNHTNNEYVESTATESPEVETVSDTEVLLTDCSTVDEKIFDATTGAEKDTISEVHNLRVRVEKLDVGWRVTEINVEEAECQP